MADAIKGFESAERIDPRLVSAHYRLGVELTKMPGRRRDSLRELAAAYERLRDPGMQRLIEQVRARTR